MSCRCKVFFLLLSIGPLLSGCLSSKKIQEQLVSRPATLHYVLEEPVPVQKTSGTIYLEVDTSDYAMPGAEVKKIKTAILPLLFYTRYRTIHQYSFGSAGARENPEAFLYSGFLREARRNCRYRFTDVKDSADYILELKLDQINATTLIDSKRETYSVGWPTGGFTHSVADMKLTEGKATVGISYRLTDQQNKPMTSGAYTLSQPLLNFDYMGDIAPWHQRFVAANAAVAECLSTCFKNNFRSVITDLNQFEPGF